MQEVRNDRQLVRQLIHKLPWFCVVIILAQICTFVLGSLTDDRSTLFSPQTGDASGALGGAFDLRSPLQNFGLNVLSSFFVHADETHLYTNLVFSFLVLIPLELRSGKLIAGLMLFSGHLAGLIGASFAFHFLSQPPLVTGMSGGLLAATVPLLAAKGKTFAMIFLSLVCIGWIIFSWHSFASHVLPIATGWLLSVKMINGKN